MELLVRAIAIAKTQVGVLEDPPGSNAGYSVEQYLKSVGIGKGFSWCAAFLYWCFGKAAGELKRTNPLVRTAGVIDHWNRAPKAAKLTAASVRKNPALVKPGLIGILLLDVHTGAGHTFLVESCTNGVLTTIEGNTAPMNSSNAGSREGIGVYRLNRRKLTDRSLVGFLDYSVV